MKSLKIIFFTLIFLFLVTFLTLINSTLLTSKIFEYLSYELPIKYTKVEGSLYTGIKIEDLNYDDMIKVENLYVKPSLLSLLVKEIYLYDLKIEKVSFENKFFEFIKQEEVDKNQEKEEDDFGIPFTLFVKNFEASLYDFTYDEQKIDEVIIKSKNIASNLKDFISAEIFTNIKSNIANLEANINIDKNIYKMNSKIDLNEYIKTTFNLEANGNLEKVDFVLKNDNLKIEREKQIFDIKDFKLFGSYDLKSSDLNITDLNAILNYDQILSNIKATAYMQNHDIETLNFNIDLQTSIKKEIYKSLKNDLKITSNLNGNLKEIKFTSNLESNELNIDKNILKIESSIVDGLAKIKDKNLNIFADFSLLTNLGSKKSKIELKLNFDKIEDLSFSVKSIVQNLNYENYNLKSLENITIDSFYKRNSLSVNLNSKIANLSLKSPNLKKFIFDLNINDLNPKQFYDFDKSINISKFRGKIKGEYENNLFFDANLVLNDSFFLDANFVTNKENFKSTIKNSSFLVNMEKIGDFIKINANIKELKDLEKELNKILKIPKLGLEGLVNANLELNSKSLENLNFRLNSPKIKLENEKIENIDIKGELKNKTVYFDKLNFDIDTIYDMKLQKRFSLLNEAFFNIEDFNGNFNFDNIFVKTLKNDENITLSINTNNLSIGHASYGNGILNSNLNINIDKENKIFVQGDIKTNNLKAIYNIPAMSISKDKDIIIVSKDSSLIKKDYFTENIALELIIFADDIKYNVKNIDLKAKTVLNIKKEFSKGVRLYGSVHDVAGTFTELGKTYKIESSSVYFRGLDPINPILDIKASTKVEDVDIFILISGTLNNPRINLNSNPVMNYKDILSYLIFGTSFSNTTNSAQSKQSQASLFLLNELSKDYAKELGVDSIYFQYDPTTQYIETHVGKNIGEKNKIVLKNKAQSGQLVFMRELTKLWNLELGFEEKTQSIDLIYKKRY